MKINKMLAEMGGEPPMNARFLPASAPGTAWSGAAPCKGGGYTASCGCASSCKGGGYTDSRDCGKCERGAAHGPLPCHAPIAMSYTPPQEPEECRFEPANALARGTLFAGLELPLWNDYRVGSLPPGKLSEYQALAFAALELALYLDTHPEDEEAMRLYNAYQRAANEKQAEFSCSEFPLSHGNNTDNSGRYAWVDDPWPWQAQRAGRGNC